MTEPVWGIGIASLEKALRHLEDAAPGIKPQAQRGRFVVTFDSDKNPTRVHITKTLREQITKFLQETPEDEQFFFVVGTVTDVSAGQKALDVPRVQALGRKLETDPLTAGGESGIIPESNYSGLWGD